MENNDYNIIIGGVRRNIISFETLLQLEPGNITTGEEPLKVSEYLSMLFMNLGYDKCPKDLSFIPNGIPIENTIRDQVLDYRMTSRILTVNPRGTTLYEMLEIIKYWCRGKIEQGSIIDVAKSFKLPDDNEIAYNLTNGIDIKRKCYICKEVIHWNTSDIYTRRLHNINPNINSYYYTHCIRNFIGYAKQIIVPYPCAVFAACVIDPDILMSIIRNCEIKAAEIADNNFGGYSSIRRDYATVLEFIPLFNSQIEMLKNIYMTSGAFGFVPQNQGEVNPVELVQKMEFDLNNINNQNSMTPAMKEQDISSYVLTGDDKAFIYNYILKRSMPEFISKTTKTNKEQLEYNTMYEPFMKHLKYLLEQLMNIAPNIMSSKDKFIVSRPFFLGPNAFGIYLRSENLYVLLTPNIDIIPCTPKQAVMYYKNLYNKDIRLDPDEIGESLEAPECKDVNLSNINSDIETTSSNIVLPHNITIQNSEYQPAILDSNTDYSLSRDRYVEN